MARRTIENVYDKCVNIEKHVIKTNGKVLRNTWASNLALTLGAFLAGVLIVMRLV